MSDELKNKVKEKRVIKEIKVINGTKVIYVENMHDYSKDPVFRKKHEKMKAFLEKHPIPEELKIKK